MNFKLIYMTLACFLFAWFCPLNTIGNVSFNGQIVIPSKYTPAEFTARSELINYLSPCLTTYALYEGDPNITTGAIWIGPTQKLTLLRGIADFTPYNATLGGNQLLNYVSDSEAPSGYAVRLAPGGTPNSYYTMPLKYGVYNCNTQRQVGTGTLAAESVVGSGYHYYKLMDITTSASEPNAYFYFFGDWTLQYVIGGGIQPNVDYAVWASIKFTGSSYPYGKSTDDNGIFVERIFLVPSTLNFNSAQAVFNSNPLLSVVPATDTESGNTVRLAPGTPLGDYALPLAFGAYSPSLAQSLDSSTLTAADVTGAGYHYYKLLENVNADRDFHFYFFSNGNLQYPMYDMIAQNGPGKYTIWGRIKFTGSGYPYGSGSPDYIFVDRLIAVKNKTPITIFGGKPAFGNSMMTLITDSNAPSGKPVRLLPGTNPASIYLAPFALGGYCPTISESQGSCTSGSVSGSSYTDYNLGTITPAASNFYIYFFSTVQAEALRYPMTNVLITNGPGVSYEIHASIKVIGTAYGGTGTNGMYIDNVRLVPVQ